MLLHGCWILKRHILELDGSLQLDAHATSSVLIIANLRNTLNNFEDEGAKCLRRHQALYVGQRCNKANEAGNEGNEDRKNILLVVWQPSSAVDSLVLNKGGPNV